MFYFILYVSNFLSAITSSYYYYYFSIISYFRFAFASPWVAVFTQFPIASSPNVLAPSVLLVIRSSSLASPSSKMLHSSSRFLSPFLIFSTSWPLNAHLKTATNTAIINYPKFHAFLLSYFLDFSQQRGNEGTGVGGGWKVGKSG